MPGSNQVVTKSINKFQYKISMALDIDEDSGDEEQEDGES